MENKEKVRETIRHALKMSSEVHSEVLKEGKVVKVSFDIDYSSYTSNLSKAFKNEINEVTNELCKEMNFIKTNLQEERNDTKNKKIEIKLKYRLRTPKDDEPVVPKERKDPMKVTSANIRGPIPNKRFDDDDYESIESIVVNSTRPKFKPNFGIFKK